MALTVSKGRDYISTRMIADQASTIQQFFTLQTQLTQNRYDSKAVPQNISDFAKTFANNDPKNEDCVKTFLMHRFSLGQNSLSKYLTAIITKKQALTTAEILTSKSSRQESVKHTTSQKNNPKTQNDVTKTPSMASLGDLVAKKARERAENNSGKPTETLTLTPSPIKAPNTPAASPQRLKTSAVPNSPQPTSVLARAQALQQSISNTTAATPPKLQSSQKASTPVTQNNESAPMTPALKIIVTPPPVITSVNPTPTESQTATTSVAVLTATPAQSTASQNPWVKFASGFSSLLKTILAKISALFKHCCG